MLGDKIREFISGEVSKAYGGNKHLFGELQIDTNGKSALEELDQLIESHKRVKELEEENKKFNTQIDIIDVEEVTILGATNKVEQLKQDALLGKALRLYESMADDYFEVFGMEKVDDKLPHIESLEQLERWYQQQLEKENTND